MKVAIFSAQRFEKEYLEAANQQYKQELIFIEARLSRQTVILAAGYPAISCFVSDKLDAPCIKILAENGNQYC